jgi:Ca2+-binding EF-hand superfamily protein
MLAIFDDVSAHHSAGGLYVDAAVSLFRQWVLRPEFRYVVNEEAIPVGPPDVPVFASLDDYKPRPAAVVHGTLLTFALFFAVIFAIDHPGKVPGWFIGAYRATGGLLHIDRSSLAETKPNTLVSVPEPEDPWLTAVASYFRRMPVLHALDADGDLVISPWEIAAAPAILRGLDRNHDGKLSAEECGFFLGPGPNSRDATYVSRMRMSYMRFSPVLAALDSDHDGEISAAEIRNSARSLRTLDKNGDGYLRPIEVVPDIAAQQAVVFFASLDMDHDGRVSAAELASAEPALREIFQSADRNHDGFTTLNELTEELRLRLR